MVILITGHLQAQTSRIVTVNEPNMAPHLRHALHLFTITASRSQHTFQILVLAATLAPLPVHEPECYSSSSSQQRDQRGVPSARLLGLGILARAACDGSVVDKI